MKKSRTGIWIILGVVLAGGVGAVIAMNRKGSLAASDEIPLAVVKRGDVEIKVHARGEVSAALSTMLTAPAIGGDALQITHLPQTGDRIKKGDVVIEFDPSEQHYKLDQNRSELQQAEQEITKAKDDALVLAAQDKVDLLKARYNVRRAELDVEKNELVSKIDGQKNDLTLQQNKRVLAELERDIESHQASGQATIFLAQEKYNKAKLAMDQAQQNLDRMHVTAPMDGLVSIQKNSDASGGFFFTGMSLPDFRPGDQVRPGSAIVQVLDPGGMNLTAHVQEDQHDNVKAGEPVDVIFDAIPAKTFRGTVKTVAGMAMQSFFNSESTHTFEVTIQLAEPDAGLRPGLTAEIVFKGPRQSSVLSIPRQALFMKDGKRIAYVRAGSSYQQHEVQIKGESETRAIIEGLPEGTEVAFLDPTVPRKSGPAGAGSAGAVGSALMPILDSEKRALVVSVTQQWTRDAELGLKNLLLHGTRSALTMLGMIFGVAAVVAMLSIGAGARQRVMAIIEQMGVHNLIVEAKETLEWQAHSKVRKISPGLTLQDYRVILDDVGGVTASTPRKRLTPSKIIPKARQDMPQVYGVNPDYQSIAGLQISNGKFFDQKDEDSGAPVCVLGAAAEWSLFGSTNALGEYVKVNEQWFRVVGIVNPQLSSEASVAGTPAVDTNNIIYVPLKSAFQRLEDSYSDVRDEIDGVYLQLGESASIPEAAQVTRAILDSSHHGADDFSIVVPAELLAEQKRTEHLFSIVMVAIASISLLVGGIGIMNIMLASILERTREIGLRRAVGARQSDIVRQFVVEAMMISFAGGSIGVVLGFIISRAIAWLAGWSTIVTFGSIALAFLVSISVGLIFGIYPATKAARLDPVEAIRYE